MDKDKLFRRTIIIVMGTCTLITLVIALLAYDKATKVDTLLNNLSASD